MSDDNTRDESKKVSEELLPTDELTPDEEELLKKKIEELRKRDPFIYR